MIIATPSAGKNLLRNGDFSRFGTNLTDEDYLAAWDIGDAAPAIHATTEAGDPISKLTLAGDTITQDFFPEWIFPSIKTFTLASVGFVGGNAVFTATGTDTISFTDTWDGVSRTVGLQVGDIIQFQGDLADSGRYRIINIIGLAITAEPFQFETPPAETSVVGSITRSLPLYRILITSRWLRESGSPQPSPELLLVFNETIPTGSILTPDLRNGSAINNIAQTTNWLQEIAVFDQELVFPPQEMQFQVSNSGAEIANVGLHLGDLASFEDGDLDFVDHGVDHENMVDPRGAMRFYRDDRTEREKFIDYEMEVASGQKVTGAGVATATGVFDATRNITVLTLSAFPAMMETERLVVSPGLGLLVDIGGFQTTWPIVKMEFPVIEVPGDLTDIYGAPADLRLVYGGFLTYDAPKTGSMQVAAHGAADLLIADGDRFRIVTEEGALTFVYVAGVGDVVIGVGTSSVTDVRDNTIAAINANQATLGVFAQESGPDRISLISDTTIAVLTETTEAGAIVINGLGHVLPTFVEAEDFETVDEVAGTVLLGVDAPIAVGDLLEITALFDGQGDELAGTFDITASITAPRIVRISTINSDQEIVKLVQVDGSALPAGWFTQNGGNPGTGVGNDRLNRFRIYKNIFAHDHITTSSTAVEQTKEGDDGHKRTASPNHVHDLIAGGAPTHFNIRMGERL